MSSNSLLPSKYFDKLVVNRLQAAGGIRSEKKIDNPLTTETTHDTPLTWYSLMSNGLTNATLSAPIIDENGVYNYTLSIPKSVL